MSCINYLRGHICSGFELDKLSYLVGSHASKLTPLAQAIADEITEGLA